MKGRPEKLNSGKILGIGLPVLFVISMIIGEISLSSWDDSIFNNFNNFFLVFQYIFPILGLPFLYWFFFQRRRKILGIPTKINGPDGVYFIIWAILSVIIVILCLGEFELAILYIFVEGLLLLLLIPFGIWMKKEGKILDYINTHDLGYNDPRDIAKTLAVKEDTVRKRIERFKRRGWLEPQGEQYNDPSRLRPQSSFMNARSYLITHPSNNILLVITLIFSKSIFVSNWWWRYWWFNVDFRYLLPGLLVNTGILFFFITAILVFSIRVTKVKLFLWLGFSLFLLGRISSFTVAYDYYYEWGWDDYEILRIAIDFLIGIAMIFLLISLSNYRRSFILYKCSIFGLIFFGLGYLLGCMIEFRYSMTYFLLSSSNFTIIILFAFIISYKRYITTISGEYQYSKDYKTAQNYEKAYNLNKAIRYYRIAGSTKDVQRLFVELGKKAEKENNLDLAIGYYNQANYRKGLRGIQRIKIDIFLKQNRVEKAAKLCEEIGEWDVAGQIRRGKITTLNVSQSGTPRPPRIRPTNKWAEVSHKSSPQSEIEWTSSTFRRKEEGVYLDSTYKDYLSEIQHQSVSSSIRNTIPDYAISHKVGAGGFATVYKAVDSDGYRIALKLPKFLEGTLDSSIYDKFESEAKMWKNLDHTNIVQLYENGLDPIPYIAMELMEGGNLKQLIAKHRLSKGETLEIMLQILDGLSYAHRMGIVHRDIKPENILFSKKGTSKLTDWGIGKFMASSSVSQTVGTKGTISYSAPEQLDKRKYGKPDWQTDIFQVGIVFYEMLTNKNPFYDEEMVGVMNNILSYVPEAPGAINPDIPPKLDRIVMKALEKRKENRWRSADIMYYELKKMIE